MGDEGEFEWDDEKAALNDEKHSLPVKAGSYIFQDPFHQILEGKPDSKTGELCYEAIGQINDVVIMTIFVYRKNRIRLISTHLVKGRRLRGYLQNRNIRTN